MRGAFGNRNHLFISYLDLSAGSFYYRYIAYDMTQCQWLSHTPVEMTFDMIEYIRGGGGEGCWLMKCGASANATSRSASYKGAGDKMQYEVAYNK